MSGEYPTHFVVELTGGYRHELSSRMLLALREMRWNYPVMSPGGYLADHRTLHALLARGLVIEITLTCTGPLSFKNWAAPFGEAFRAYVLTPKGADVRAGRVIERIYRKKKEGQSMKINWDDHKPNESEARVGRFLLCARMDDDGHWMAVVAIPGPHGRRLTASEGRLRDCEAAKRSARELHAALDAVCAVGEGT